MSQEAEFLEKVEELYWLLGHKVESVIRRNKTTTDLIVKSNKGDKWLVRCEHVREVNESAVSSFARLVQTENTKQAAIITAGRIKLEARQLVNSDTIYLLDGKVFWEYLNRARASVRSKVNPVSFAIKGLVWHISRRFTLRTYRPFRREPFDKPSHAATHKSRYPVIREYPCPFCKRPVGVGLSEIHFRLECPEASKYMSATPPTPPPPALPPKRMFPEDLVSPREEKIYTTDEHGVVISMEEYRELHKR